MVWELSVDTHSRKKEQQQHQHRKVFNYRSWVKHASSQRRPRRRPDCVTAVTNYAQLLFFLLSHCRYIAVTQPIKYAKHKNSRRVCLTILLVWAISAAIGSPIVLGLNNTPDRVPDLCLFYNSDFIVYSSLSSFYIPCIIMVFLYWSIFKVSSPSFSSSYFWVMVLSGNLLRP
jgi:hypothetical protein